MHSVVAKIMHIFTIVRSFSYIEKFTEFLRLFVSIHLRRFESNSQFPVLEFLGLLHKYTFKQVGRLVASLACLYNHEGIDLLSEKLMFR